VPFYRRHLPHLYEIGTPLFLTWRLYGSLPANRAFPEASLTSGQAFDALDRLLDAGCSGPLYLRDPAVASMVTTSIEYSAGTLGHFNLHAFVIMLNHVHLLVTPNVPLPKLTKSLKSFTGRKANEILNLAAGPFWQEESYDHLIRNRQEFDRIAYYIEQNPVRAGLVKSASEYRWSSASRAAKSAG
jgi:REP element-mobilizing transposase RayT